MRADLEYITGVLDELESLVQDASKAPMNRGRSMVDRTDMLVIVEELRNSLPQELEEAKAARREHESMLSAAREEAERTVENARREAQEMAEGSEPYRRAQRLAAENDDRAEKYSQEVSRGAEVYREQVMARLERWFGESLESVSESRRELDVPEQKREKAAPEPSGAEEPEADDDDKRGWRVSSA